MLKSAYKFRKNNSLKSTHSERLSANEPKDADSGLAHWAADTVQLINLKGGLDNITIQQRLSSNVIPDTDKKKILPPECQEAKIRNHYFDFSIR